MAIILVVLFSNGLYWEIVNIYQLRPIFVAWKACFHTVGGHILGIFPSQDRRTKFGNLFYIRTQIQSVYLSLVLIHEANLDNIFKG